MDVNVYDADLNRLGVVDEITSLIWTRRYWRCGEFHMLLPATAKHVDMLKMGRLVIPHGYNEAGEIQYVHMAANTNGQEEIEVQGKFLPSWLNKRLVLRQIVTTDAPSNIAHRIIAENVISPSDPARAIPQLSHGEEWPGGMEMEYTSVENVYVLDELEGIAATAEMGFRVVSNPRTKRHAFETYVGRDLTAGNTAGNEPCIFSREFDNVSRLEYINSRENLRTMAYVYGDEEENGNRPMVDIGAGLSGLARSELYVSASDIARTYKNEAGNDITMSDAEYSAMLRQRGESELSQYAETDELDSEINPRTSLVYRHDYDVGDMVTCVDRRWGLTQNVRITEAREIYQTGAKGLEIVFGKPLPTLSDRIKQLTKGG